MELQYFRYHKTSLGIYSSTCKVEKVRNFASEASHAQKPSWTRRIGASLIQYGRNLKWVPIPLGVGFAYICYQQYGHIKKRERRKELQSQGPEDRLATRWQAFSLGLDQRTMQEMHIPELAEHSCT